MADVQLIAGVIDRCGDIEFFLCQSYLSFNIIIFWNGNRAADGERKKAVLCIIYKGRTNIRGTTFFCPVLTEGAFLGMRPKAGISLRGNGRSRRGLARGETQRSGRSSKAIFSGVPAPLSSIPRLSGAGFCRVLSFSQPLFHH